VDVVITGASGNIGAALVGDLPETGVVDHVPGLARRSVETGPGDATWLTADLTRADLVPPLRGLHALVHPGLAVALRLLAIGSVSRWERGTRVGSVREETDHAEGS
jgi:nucleoside-diphosphate-sugar epimerase